MTQEKNILQIADELTSGDRQNDYGHPYYDFTKTGIIWQSILMEWAKKTNGDAPVPPELVALCQIGVKISRLCNAYKKDSVVDIAGYARTFEMVMDKCEELKKGISDSYNKKFIESYSNLKKDGKIF